jgi:hypothetical protein
VLGAPVTNEQTDNKAADANNIFDFVAEYLTPLAYVFRLG